MLIELLELWKEDTGRTPARSSAAGGHNRKVGARAVFDVGSSTFALDEAPFVSAELVGSSIAIRLIGAAEVVAYPWRDAEGAACCF